MRTARAWVALSALLAGCGGEDGGGSGPSRIDVYLLAESASFQHDDGLAGQTPKNTSVGVRSLRLFSDAGEPWVVFDRAASATIASYDAGERTWLAAVFADKVEPGSYVRARLVQDWVRFDVDATLHADDAPSPGTLSALLVTSDGTPLGGETRASGYYEYELTSETGTEKWTGTDAAVPGYTTDSGVEAALEDGEWATYFPVDLEIGSADGVLTIAVNVHESFRWQDAASGANQAGVWDIAPPDYEPVRQLGGNRFEATLKGR